MYKTRWFTAISFSEISLNEGTSSMVVGEELEAQGEYWMNLQFLLGETYRRKSMHIYVCIYMYRYTHTIHTLKITLQVQLNFVLILLLFISPLVLIKQHLWTTTFLQNYISVQDGVNDTGGKIVVNSLLWFLSLVWFAMVVLDECFKEQLNRWLGGSYLVRDLKIPCSWNAKGHALLFIPLPQYIIDSMGVCLR